MHTHHDHTEGAPSVSAAEPPTPVDPEELAAAQAVLDRHRESVQARVDACTAELQAVLDRHGMALQAGRPSISVVPVTL